MQNKNSQEPEMGNENPFRKKERERKFWNSEKKRKKLGAQRICITRDNTRAKVPATKNSALEMFEIYQEKDTCEFEPHRIHI